MIRTISLAIAGVFACSAALAEPSVTVRYDDLNLQSHTGASVMLSRIHAASHRVCGTAPLLADLAGSDAYRRCLRETSDRAIARLNAPLVTAALRGLGATSQTVAAVGDAR